MSSSELVAEVLLQIEAVRCNIDEPFKLTSGTLSPTYIDCRKLISFLEPRRKVIAEAAKLIDAQVGRANIDLIAGGETAGIPYAAWISETLDLPMAYVRKQPKGFGRLKQIEGEMAPGKRVLLVEDLAFDAGSKVTFAEAIREAEGLIDHCFVVFSYGREQSAAQLEKARLSLHALTDWEVLLDTAVRKGYFTETQVAEIRDFLRDPPDWHERRQQRKAQET